MSRRSAVLATAIACCLLLPAASEGQHARHGVVHDVLRPLAWGALTGLGLAVAYSNPTGEGWLVSDEAALPLAVAAGLGTALLVRRASAGLERSEGRRPRLRVSAGTGGEMDWDYALAYRTPLGERFEVDAAILVVNDTWETIETETRCGGLFGCITGDFVTDYRYQQSVSALIRGVYPLRRTTRWNPALAVGGGPTVVHVETPGVPASRRTGLLLDAALAVERGGGRRWTAATGFRLTPVGAGNEADIDNGTWYVRFGLAWGG